MSEEAPLSVSKTNIPGLLVVDLPVHGDIRGWFKENWQREKMVALGLPDFSPVQNNVSFNSAVGTTRGIHAEPWDKFVSVTAGEIFGAWVDLREGATFGATYTTTLGPSRAVFVPRGVGNSYQTLAVDTSYSYLVNDHWSPDATYTFLNLADETANIPWPIDLNSVVLSDKDKIHPRLGSVVPMKRRRTLILGANGQVGRALKSVFPDAELAGHQDFDLAMASSFQDRDWSAYDLVINAAAYTNVDGAETNEGRELAWASNAHGVARLAQLSQKHGFPLVHISSDYVFDGTKELYTELDSFSPLGVYGQTKAAGDVAMYLAPQSYVIRTSWVIGEGANFVHTMATLAGRGADPAVVEDQFGRLSFAHEIARAVKHLVDSKAPFGTYNVTSQGQTESWASIAKRVFELLGHDPQRVTGVSTETYFADKPHSAPRPRYSLLDLTKIEGTGFVPADGADMLSQYLASLV